MALTSIQKELVQALKLCDVPREGIITIMLLLKEDDKADCMIDWLVENPNADENQILRRAVILSELLQ